MRIFARPKKMHKQRTGCIFSDIGTYQAPCVLDDFEAVCSHSNSGWPVKLHSWCNSKSFTSQANQSRIEQVLAASE